jgi:hypothetical protein
MRCLGGLHGAGILTCGDETIARAAYDFDGYLSKVGQMTACGEIRMSREALREVFGRKESGCVQRVMPRMWMSSADCRRFPGGATNRTSTGSDS